MATKNIASFEELTKLASDFVTAQKGLWDHAAWTDFLSKLRTKGLDVSGDMESRLGELLEAMKRFYSAAASTESVEKAMRTVVSDSVAFIKKHQGIWGHSDWEDFVKTLRQNTQVVSEGTTSYLGGVLESMKVFYQLSPVAIVQKRVSAVRAKSSSTPTPALTAEKKTEAKPAVGKAPAEPKAAVQPAPKAPERVVPKTASKPDDLTVIGGIGPALAKKLNGVGITSYAQIAALSDADIAKLDKSLNFKGRIKRDDWVGQAKKLS